MIDGGLRTLFRENLPSWHWVAVESPLTGRGTPDSNYCVSGVEGWVEYKLTTAWAVPMRPEQIAWLDRRSRAGGRCWVAIRRRSAASKRQPASLDELWLVPGSWGRVLKDGGLRSLPTDAVRGRWVGGPRLWAWVEVGEVLRYG